METGTGVGPVRGRQRPEFLAGCLYKYSIISLLRIMDTHAVA